MKIVDKPVEPSPMEAPEWLTQRVEELSRLMSSSPKSVADGIWYELIQRKLVSPRIASGRVLGPLGWKPSVTLNGEPLTRETAAQGSA